MVESAINKTTTARQLRFVSYNVHACVGRDGRFAPARIVNVLRDLDADFIGLQEVEDRRVHGTSVIQYLADELDMHATSGPTLRRGDDDYGNLLLSKSRPATVSRHDISVSKREPRGIIDATFDAHGIAISALVTHLGLAASERRAQLQQLLPRISAQSSGLAILMADFNEWRPGNALHRELRKLYEPCRPLRTFPSQAPLLALDRIYVAPAGHIERVHVDRTGLARIASDHLPLVADVSVLR